MSHRPLQPGVEAEDTLKQLGWAKGGKMCYLQSTVDVVANKCTTCL